MKGILSAELIARQPGHGKHPAGRAGTRNDPAARPCRTDSGIDPLTLTGYGLLNPEVPHDVECND
jgi:hypothetical protein